MEKYVNLENKALLMYCCIQNPHNREFNEEKQIPEQVKPVCVNSLYGCVAYQQQ